LTFIDTSALLAFLDRDAEQHGQIRESMAQALRDREAITHNYVLVETEALAHRRLGGRAVRALLEDLVPALEIVWVDGNLHDTAVDAHLGALRRRSSLVDHVSFELMRRLDLHTALALDDDFAREGFELLPG
jgi:predicted nucleic acid-binding protein